MTLGAGQFCTNPGLVVGVGSPLLASFIQSAADRFSESTSATMLNANIHRSYESGVEALSGFDGVELRARGTGEGNASGTPALFTTDSTTFMRDETLSHEVFGPSTLVVEGKAKNDLLDVAEKMEGHLTATIHGTENDLAEYAELVALLEIKVGRIIFNGFPTGVEVCPSMNHGGPYPAASDIHYTSVGTAAIFRFARPICYQGFPESSLPLELQDANPLGISRIVNGDRTKNPLS